MKNVTKQVIDSLSDLIQINNDRTQCYEKAADEIADPFEAEIKTVFYQMADESRRFAGLLSLTYKNVTGEHLVADSYQGEVYHQWNELKVSFSGNDVLTSIQSCQCTDAAVLKAYLHAITLVEGGPETVRETIVNQYKSLKASYDRIQRYHNEFVDKVKLV